MFFCVLFNMALEGKALTFQGSSKLNSFFVVVVFINYCHQKKDETKLTNSSLQTQRSQSPLLLITSRGLNLFECLI